MVAPIMQSATFVNTVGSGREVLSRYGNNPNQQSLASKYALLEGAEDGVRGQRHGRHRAGPSGGAGPGRQPLASRWIYGGTLKLFDEEFGRLGIPSPMWTRRPPGLAQVDQEEHPGHLHRVPVNPTIRVLDLARSPGSRNSGWRWWTRPSRAR